MKYSFYILLLLILPAQLFAIVELNSLFADSMVLQRQMPLRVWGNASEGEMVSVEFNGQWKQTKTVHGKWSVSLDPMEAGGAYSMIIRGDNRIQLNDIYIGEVWICAGQSNMARPLGLWPGQQPIHHWEQERAGATNRLIRQYHIPVRVADEPLDDAKGTWKVCSPENVVKFSAIGYFFARDLYRAIRVPIGIILAASGGTPAEDWCSREGLAEHPQLEYLVREYERRLYHYPVQLANHKRDPEKYPVNSGNPAESPHVYGHYNAMVAPLFPFAVRGVTWFQGEANRRRATEYRTLFQHLITEWRTRWAQPALPFLFVQLTPYKDTNPEIRDAQFYVWQHTDHTAMVVTTDYGEAEDIHSPFKQPVGYRLSLAARALAYGEQIIYSGPVCTSARRQKSKVTLEFTHTGDGLVAKNGTLRGFEIAGTDQQFYPAKGQINGRKITVYSEKVPDPATVRYAWSNVPDVNLYNSAHLPAVPFRLTVRE